MGRTVTPHTRFWTRLPTLTSCPPTAVGPRAVTAVAVRGGRAGCWVSPATWILRKFPVVAATVISKNGFTVVGGVVDTIGTTVQPVRFTLGLFPTKTWKDTP